MYFCFVVNLHQNRNECTVNYHDFHKQWRELGCFSIQQVYTWKPDFNRTNINYWIKKGYLVKLRNGWYAFSECLSMPDFVQYIANRIYRPSYISVHTALSHYGMIPEAVMKITSVTTLKTAEFINDFGCYTYQTVKPEMMFGYEPKPMNDGRTILFATPEKALLDLLYLYPFYDTVEDMTELRLDEDFMHEDFNKDVFLNYAAQLKSPRLNSRINNLLEAYCL